MAKENTAYRKNGILIYPKMRYGFPHLPWPYEMAEQYYKIKIAANPKSRKCPHCGKEINV